MATIDIGITEDRIDQRSNEVSVTFTVANTGKEKLALVTLTPRTPEGADIIRVHDESREATKEVHARLCGQLKELLRTHLVVADGEYRAKVVAVEGDILKEAIASLPRDFWKVYLSAFFPYFRKTFQRRFEKRQAFLFNISEHKDAELAWSTWLAGIGDGDPIKKLFSTKMVQLKEIEAKLGRDLRSSVLATVEPGDRFSRGYVVRLRRGMLTQKTLTVSVDCEYVQSATPGDIGLLSQTKTITVTPYPVCLSFVAVSSGLLGAILRYTLTGPVATSGREFLLGIVNTLTTNRGLSAALLALVFFNVFEHTGLGKKLKFGIDWRAALLIGAMCGLGEDRFVAALKALVGIT